MIRLLLNIPLPCVLYYSSVVWQNLQIMSFDYEFSTQHSLLEDGVGSSCVYDSLLLIVVAS